MAVWGRCWEAEDAPPFWPWIQILRTLLQCEEAAGVLASEPDVAAGIGRLVPVPGTQNAIATGPGSTVGLAAPEGEVDRFRLLDAVTQLVRRVGVQRPMVLLLRLELRTYRLRIDCSTN